LCSDVALRSLVVLDGVSDHANWGFDFTPLTQQSSSLPSPAPSSLSLAGSGVGAFGSELVTTARPRLRASQAQTQSQAHGSVDAKKESAGAFSVPPPAFASSAAQPRTAGNVSSEKDSKRCSFSSLVGRGHLRACPLSGNLNALIKVIEQTAREFIGAQTEAAAAANTEGKSGGVSADAAAAADVRIPFFIDSLLSLLAVHSLHDVAAFLNRLKLGGALSLPAWLALRCLACRGFIPSLLCRCIISRSGVTTC
jgi:hypothetical protein